MSYQQDNFMGAYLSYIGETEAPITFHRWACLSILGAWLGRSYSFKLGHFSIYPNMYAMLMGGPGTRKTTAIKIASSLLKKAGYTKIAAERTTKEKFLMDLSGQETDLPAKDLMEQNLFGESNANDAEIMIAADEFNMFVGNGNIEFLSLLGVLWDYEGDFEDRKKNSKSFIIRNPSVSMLAGNTPTGFSLAFPPEAIGQGIFSRLILVHGESTGKKITFPEPPAQKELLLMLERLSVIKTICNGVAPISDEAKVLLDKIYKTYQGVQDVRFESYNNRRFSHLLKLCLLISASYYRAEITTDDVIYANTILYHTEHTMPKALGEFGKARHSDVAHKIVQVLESAPAIVTVKELWKQVHNDLEDIAQMKDMLANLVLADKIISTKGGFLARRKLLEETSNDIVNFSLLTDEERSYIS